MSLPMDKANLVNIIEVSTVRCDFKEYINPLM